MLNFHGGTTISTASLVPLGLAGSYVSQYSGHIVIAGAFLILSMTTSLLLVATLTRFFINFRKNAKAISNQGESSTQ